MARAVRSGASWADHARPGLGWRLLVAAAVLLLAVRVPMGADSQAEPMARIAVFPVENLSVGSIPGEEIRRVLSGRLGASGFAVLDAGELEAFMSRHRVRYAAGIDAETAAALRRETGVDGVVIASVDLFSAAVPPKVALTVRLVSVRETPAVVWADDAGLSGDDAPGLLELGMVNDYKRLLAAALERVSDSLVRHLQGRPGRRASGAASKFKPKMTYRGLTLEPGRQYSVAVVPFFNLSDRRNAGEIMALLFLRHLSSIGQFRLVDTGVARRQLLDARVIMDGGLSITDAEMVAALIEADFVLGGRVVHYEDYEGPAGRTRVDFSTLLVDRKTRRVVWVSQSDNSGTDGVWLFERGTSRTAHAMATQMVRLTAGMIAGRTQ